MRVRSVAPGEGPTHPTSPPRSPARGARGPAGWSRWLLAAALVLAACAGLGGRDRLDAPMGSWPAWVTLDPLVELARHQAPPEVQQTLRDAAALLKEGKAASADRVLARAMDGTGRHWIAVARADLAAIHFTRCIRGVAWRLEDRPLAGAPNPKRLARVESERLGDNDVSVEALLTNLEAALQTQSAALQVQARIARARMTTFVVRCPATPDVAALAERTLRADLAQLAAEAHLTPDLAFVWAAIQLDELSPAAARPYLEQAKAGGFPDPTVDLLLGIVAFELREHDRAEGHARAALAAFEAHDAPEALAQTWVLLAEIAQARDDRAGEREAYERALALDPAHPGAVLGLLRLSAARAGPARAASQLRARIVALAGPGELDEARAARLAEILELWLVHTDDSLELAELLHDALLDRIDAHDDPALRGLLYFGAAVLDARLGDYRAASGRAASASAEFEEAGLDPPVDVERLREQLARAQR